MLVTVSGQFLGRIAGVGGAVKIKGLKDVKEMYEVMIYRKGSNANVISGM